MHASTRDKQAGRTPAPAGWANLGDRPVRHVLIVDDEADLRRMLVLLFKSRGYEPTAVASGEQALAELAERPYDVVLSDIRMPKLDGLELIDEIQGASCRPR